MNWKGDYMVKDSFLNKLKSTKTEKKRLTIYLTNGTAKKLKLYAAQNDKKVSDIVEDVLAIELLNVKTF